MVGRIAKVGEGEQVSGGGAVQLMQPVAAFTTSWTDPQCFCRTSSNSLSRNYHLWARDRCGDTGHQTARARRSAFVRWADYLRR